MKKIYAEELQNAFCESCDAPFELNCSIEECRKKGTCRIKRTIDAAPAAGKRPTAEEDKPVIHAHWIISSDGYYPYCSNCNHWPKRMTKVCAGRGAIMDEEDKNGAKN